MANRKIILITTKGCVGCRIQRENIEKAIINSKINIGFEVIDFDTLTKKEVIEYRNKRVFLKDFPTTIFMIDNVITFKMTGSTPAICITRYIDLYIKKKC